MTIEIRSSALGDLRSGYRYYERKEADLGAYFLDRIYSDIDTLHSLAGIHPIRCGKYHRLLSKKFPFGIYYMVSGDLIEVRAVLDLRRDPKWIARKLKRLG